MANSDVSTRDTQLEKQRLGYIAISFSNMDNTSEPKIQAGSVVEIAGTLYSVSSEESNSDWGTISNSTQAYLILDPASDSSSFSAKWSDSTPVWSEAKYGWYGDGTNEDADNRYVLRCYKDSSGDYIEKYLYRQLYNNIYHVGDVSVNGRMPLSEVETLSTAGSSTWTVPREVYRIKATIIGAGGGGGGSDNSDGSSGDSTTFNSITAGGGAGGRAASSSHAGRDGEYNFCSSNYGTGGWYLAGEDYGENGGGGEIIIKSFSVTPGNSISYTVGAGGAGGSGGGNPDGGDGEDGQIIIEY